MSVVIIGAGQAGATAAAELRRQGFEGRILLIGAEDHAPYERPPLSKNVLLQPESTRCAIFSDDFYEKQRIELKLGNPVRAIDTTLRTLVLSDGEICSFDQLLLATGARVRRLPLLDQLGDNVYTLRTLDDARRLLPMLCPGRHILVVGGGVIGLELASSAVDLGVQVTLIEQASTLMGRCSPPILNAYLGAVHRARGVSIHLGASIVDATREQGELRIDLADGTQLRGDAIIYGIGVEPDTELASAAGLEVDNGILIDENGVTSHAAIYAAGDAARQRDGIDVRYIRRETWENANNQAISAVRTMLGLAQNPIGVPWFWTDQCQMNIQFAGDMAAHEWIVRGSMEEEKFVLFGLTHGHIVGGITVNQGRDMRSVKALIAANKTIKLSILCDLQHDLRSLL